MTAAPTPEQIQACDREPIHIPGAIQPHGVLLALDRDSLTVRMAAGDVAGLLGVDAWLGRSMGARIMDARIERAQLARREGALVEHGIATEDRVCDQRA